MARAANLVAMRIIAQEDLALAQQLLDEKLQHETDHLRKVMDGLPTAKVGRPMLRGFGGSAPKPQSSLKDLSQFKFNQKLYQYIYDM